MPSVTLTDKRTQWTHLLLTSSPDQDHAAASMQAISQNSEVQQTLFTLSKDENRYADIALFKTVTGNHELSFRRLTFFKFETVARV